MGPRTLHPIWRMIQSQVQLSISFDLVRLYNHRSLLSYNINNNNNLFWFSASSLIDTYSSRWISLGGSKNLAIWLMVFYVEQIKKYCQSLIRFKDNIENELFEFLVLEKLKPLSDRHYDDTKKAAIAFSRRCCFWAKTVGNISPADCLWPEYKYDDVKTIGDFRDTWWQQTHQVKFIVLGNVRMLGTM